MADRFDRAAPKDRRTPAAPSMIVASIDAGKRAEAGFVTHV